MKYFLKKSKTIFAFCIVLGAVSSAIAAFFSIIMQKIIDIASTGDASRFTDMIIFTVIYLVVLYIFAFAGSLCGKMLIRNITRDIREEVFDGVMSKSPMSFFTKNNADYLSALTNDVKMVEENYIIPLLMTVEMVVMFIATIGILLYLSPLVTVFLIVGMLLMFIIPTLLGKILEKRQDLVSKKLSEFTTRSKDFFGGFEIIRGFNILPFTKTRFNKLNKDTADVKFKADKILAINEGLSDMLSLFVIMIIVFVSSYLLMKGNITAGTLMALVQLSGTFMSPIMIIMQNIPKIKGIKPVVDRLNAFKVQDEEFKGTETPTFSNAIKISGLNFSYNTETENQALNNIELKFEKGKKYAIVGHSGSGKSSLIKLLTGYTNGYKGTIKYDNNELKSLDVDRLGEIISTVHQNVFLFDSTIKENIGLYSEFTEDEWNRALQLSGVDLFVNDKDEKLDYQVGENGNNLSGGQKQRVAVARALIRKTPVVVLDEGTSSIDKKTSADIEDSLLSQKDLTVINITHHLSKQDVQKYDEIIMMDEGEIKPFDVDAWI